MPIKLEPWQTHPETIKYWGAVLKSIKMREWNDDSVLPREDSPPDVKRCPRCNNAGFILQVRRYNGQEVSREYVACDQADCPGRVKHLARARQETLAASEIPIEYAKMTFALWEKLKAKAPKKGADGKLVQSIDGKRDALGAAHMFYERREHDYAFTLNEAAAFEGLPPPVDAKEKELDKGARLNSIGFFGANGVGKTSLMAATGNALLADGRTVVYVRMSRFFLALRERMGERKQQYETAGNAEDEATVMKLYAEAPILMIDEFPLEATGWQKERGGELINERYSNGRPTIFTTNALQWDDLVPAWDHLVVDRLANMAHMLRMGGLPLRTTRSVVESR